jgi:hypothetical protein
LPLEPTPPSGFVTCAFRHPVGAEGVIVTLKVIDVAEFTEVTVAVTPTPENATTAPGWNPVPVSVTGTFVLPCGS